MHFLFAQAAAAAQGAAPSTGSTLAPVLFQVTLIIGIFWFIVLRPQQKERKRVENSLLALKRGDEVATVGGIIGEVVHIQMGAAAEGAEPVAKMDDRITIKSAESKLVVERGRIARVTPRGT
jgi:preprotein translocase subunit YajC